MKSMSSFTELRVIPRLSVFCGTPKKSYFDTNKFKFPLTSNCIFCPYNGSPREPNLFRYEYSSKYIFYTEERNMRVNKWQHFHFGVLNNKIKKSKFFRLSAAQQDQLPLPFSYSCFPQRYCWGLWPFPEQWSPQPFSPIRSSSQNPHWPEPQLPPHRMSGYRKIRDDMKICFCWRGRWTHHSAQFNKPIRP